MPSPDVQASISTSGPNVRVVSDSVVSTVVTGNTGSYATGPAVDTVIAVPIPSGATRTSWTRLDQGTLSGASAGTTSGVGAINQTLSFDVGEYAIYSIVDVLPSTPGASYQINGVVTAPAGNHTALSPLVGPLLACVGDVTAISSTGGIQLRLEGSPRKLTAELLIDNHTVEIVGGVVRAKVSPHARGSSAANPLGPDPDGSGLNIPVSVTGGVAPGNGLSYSGNQLNWSNVHVHFKQIINVALGSPTTISVKNKYSHDLFLMIGAAWHLRAAQADLDGILKVKALYRASTSPNVAVTPADASASMIAASHKLAEASANYTDIMLNGNAPVVERIKPGETYEVSVLAYVENGTVSSGLPTFWVTGLPFVA